jgi:hypothetical protein
MRYFATADGNDADAVKLKSEGSGMTEVEEQILGKANATRLCLFESDTILTMNETSYEPNHGSFWKRQNN